MATGDKLIQVQHLEKHYNHGAIKALEQYGPCPIHRMSFLKKFYEQK